MEVIQGLWRCKPTFLTLLLALGFWRVSPCMAQAAGATFYVSPTGNDANPGTREHPWRTIAKAAASLGPGETVLIRAGRYREKVVPQRSGEPDRFITYAAFPGEEAIIDGTGVVVEHDGGLIEIVDRSWIRVKSFRIQDSVEAGILADRSEHLVFEENHTLRSGCSGIGVWSSRDVAIEHNEVALSNSGGWQEAITVAGTDGFVVRDNEVYNGAAGYNKEGICLKDGSSHGKAFSNRVHHVRAVGIYVDAWDKETSDIEVFGNDVHDILNGDGIALASEMGGMLQRIRVYNNLSWNNRFVGISITRNGDATHHPMNAIAIVNNTVYGNGTGDWGGGILVDNPDVRSSVIRNNIAAGNLTFEVADESSREGEVVIDHNLMDTPHDVPEERPGTNPRYGDPHFVNPGAGNLRLLPESPAINGASALDAPADDHDGLPRPQGGSFDIGAFEFSAR